MKLEDRMRLSIRRRSGHVVLRSEVAGLGSASQVSHALKALQQRGELLRLGAGVYAKADRDVDSGEVRPTADFETLVRETAAKLKMLGDASFAGVVGAEPATHGGSGALVLDTGRRRISRKLRLGNNSVAYVNDRMRSRDRGRDRGAGSRLEIPTSGVGPFVRDLARRYGVSYAPTVADQWAETSTLLAGDEVRSGLVQDLLVALKRAGKISTDEMAALLVNYLRERRQVARSA